MMYLSEKMLNAVANKASRLLSDYPDWVRDPEGYSITVDMPGVSKDNITIEFKTDEDVPTLYICGMRGDRKYAITTIVPSSAASEKIAATLENGVLTVRAPINAAAVTRKIPIA
jgi:HSP20 family molecular chaperone IbpA